MTAQHTPIPWAVHTFDLNTGDQGGVRVVGADGTTVADNETYYPHALDPANAEFIVRAVNSHALMLEALKALTALPPSALLTVLKEAQSDVDEIVDQARSAIRAATGEDA